jgi:RNA polymerase sigma factor (sigma-70 family)
MTGTQTAQTRSALHRLMTGTGAAQLTDRELLERFAESRDDTAFAVLVRRHGPLVLGSCRRILHNLQDAEDVFQATFLALARKAGAVRRSEAVAGWLYRVASRLALQVRRQCARRVAREGRAAVRSAPDPLAEVSGRDLCAALDEELNRLPEKYRLPLLLCCLEGLSRDEAARRLGWSAGALKGRLERGRELLRQRLGRRGIALSAGLAGLALTGGAGAAVPADLAAATVEAAARLAAGTTMAVPPRAAALLQVTLGGAWARLRLATAVVMAACVLGAALGLCGAVASPIPSPAEAARAAPRAEGPKRPGADLHGDPLPDGAVARLGTLRFRHEENNTHAVVFLPGGRVLATAAGDAVYLWEAATGKELARLREAVPRVRRDGVPERRDWIHALACSPDGKLLAAGHNEGIVRLWDVAARKPVRTWRAHAAPDEKVAGIGGVMDLLFAADGKSLISSGLDKALRVWDPTTGKEVRRLTGHQGCPGILTLSPDGNLLACSVWGGLPNPGEVRHEVRLWELATGKGVRSLPAPGKEPATCLAFSPDGKSLAAGFGMGLTPRAPAEVRLWELATGKETARLKGLGWQVAGLRFAPEGKTLRSLGLDGMVRDWDPATGRELRQTRMRWRGVARVTFAPDGKSLVSYGYGALHFWDVATGEERPLSAGSDWPVVPACSPDGKFVATADGIGPARLWDAATGKEVRRLAGFMERSPHFSADGKSVLTIDMDRDGVSGVFRLSETATGKELRRKKVGKHLALLAVSGDGRFLAAGGSTLNQVAHVWDVAAGKEVRAIPTPPLCYAFALSPNGRTLAVVGTVGTGGPEDRYLHLWDTATGKALHRLEPALDNQVFAVCFSPDGKTLASSGLDLKRGEPVLKLWDVASGRERLRVKPGNNITGLTFSPNGRLLAILNNGDYLASGERPQNHTVVRLLDTCTGEELHRFRGHRAAVTSAVFSRDGSHLATGSKDTTALLWAVPESIRRGGPAGAPLKAGELKALWEALAKVDEEAAYRAMGRLVAAERSVPLLAERLAASLRPDKRADTWIAELGSKRFANRARAESELRKLGEGAEGSLRKALPDAPTLEVRRRIEALLEKHGGPGHLRALRAVEVLEHVGTAEARKALEAVAGAAPDARLAGEARAASARLARLSAAKP